MCRRLLTRKSNATKFILQINLGLVCNFFNKDSNSFIDTPPGISVCSGIDFMVKVVVTTRTDYDISVAIRVRVVKLV
jgi:hypothetical protein